MSTMAKADQPCDGSIDQTGRAFLLQKPLNRNSSFLVAGSLPFSFAFLR